MGSKKKPPYDAEFREGAVRIVIETGKPVGDVAEELGINPGTLHSWVSRWRRNGTTSLDRPASGGRVREAEREELERLRREMSEKNKRIRELEMELSSFGIRRDSSRAPSALITTQWWCVLPMSTPAHISGTVTSVSTSYIDPADDLAGVALRSDRVAVPNWRSSRRGAPGGQAP